ncbi:hypothetical protein F2P45_12790 [Massilia sp. CCM 8733]|uniref:Uncharacterized protein n=1 Tax=Massilia mucilaginosa TaxID=2609282 RepID=A0ABX0NSJ6_9BURK|nr:hypothetical protein [Massilia mucilaginosa]
MRKGVAPPQARRSGKTDKRCKVVRKITIGTASEHDTLHFEAVLPPRIPTRNFPLIRGAPPYIQQLMSSILAA